MLTIKPAFVIRMILFIGRQKNEAREVALYIAKQNAKNTRASPLAASVQSDRNRNLDVIRSAIRHQGTKIKIHIIPSRLCALVAKLLL